MEEQWRREYEAYIVSKAWSRKRKALLGDENVCLGCLATFPRPQLHLHHVNYKALGKETYVDVLPLCETCHDKLHHYLKVKALTVAESAKAWGDLFGRTLPDSGWVPASVGKERKKKKYKREKRGRAGKAPVVHLSPASLDRAGMRTPRVPARIAKIDAKERQRKEAAQRELQAMRERAKKFGPLKEIPRPPLARTLDLPSPNLLKRFG